MNYEHSITDSKHIALVLTYNILSLCIGDHVNTVLLSINHTYLVQLGSNRYSYSLIALASACAITGYTCTNKSTDYYLIVVWLIILIVPFIFFFLYIVVLLDDQLSVTK